MAYLFKKDGTVNLSRVTAATLPFLGAYFLSFGYSVKQVNDPGMDPSLQAACQVYNASENIRGLNLNEKYLIIVKECKDEHGNKKT